MRKRLPSLSLNAVSALRRIAYVSLLSLAFVLTTTRSNAQAQLIKDLNRLEENSVNEYSQLRIGNGTLFFISQKKELWKSDGTPTGTIRIKTLNNISRLIWVGSSLYFVGDDGTGPELWRYNGTTTVRVKDIRPGPIGSDPQYLTNVNGILYFAANDGKSGIELWKSNGTAAGTVLVKDIFPGGGSGNPISLSNVNGTLYFSGYNNVHGAELWKSDGTAAGTVMVKDINPGSNGSQPSSIIAFNGTVYFAAHERSTGRELWKSNGTAQGTVLLKDVLPGSGSSYLHGLTVMGNAFYFSAATDRTGLWKSNGTAAGTVLVKGPEPMTADYGISYLTAINGYLYYVAGFDHTQYFWKSDGTESGTGAIIEADYYDSNAPRFTALNGKIYFFKSFYADDQSNQQLFKMNPDGTNVTLVWESISAMPHDEYLQFGSSELVALNNMLFFYGINKEGEGYKLFKSDGTPEGTSVLKDTHRVTKSSNPVNFVNVNNVIYFRTIGESVLQTEYVWRTDGTSAGTIQLKKMDKVQEIIAVNNIVYFSGFTNNKWELWKTNGTTSGTVLVKSFDYLIDDDNFYWFAPLTDVNGTLFFYNAEGELWKSDGTTAGTVMVRDFYQVLNVSPSSTLAYVLVGTSAGGQELWKTNGTSAGTVKVKTIRTTSHHNEQQRFPTATLNNIFYFIGNDGVHGFELWRSNGTTAGTYMVTDLRTGDHEEVYTDIWRMTIFKDNLIISAAYDADLWALYKTNGTSAGTTKIININPIQGFIPNGDQLLLFPQNDHEAMQELWATDGSSAGTTHVKTLDNNWLSYNISYEVVDGTIYFTTAEFSKLWRTDGTECGTFSVPLNVTNVSPLERIGSNFIFGGYSSLYGKEIYRYNIANVPSSPCGHAIAARSTTAEESAPIFNSEEEIITSAPNPFTSTFEIQVNSKSARDAQLTVFNSLGHEIERVEQLQCNTRHAIGQTWPVGMYIVKIEVEGKVIPKKMIKK